MICPRVFLHLGLDFTSDGEDFLVEMCILLSLEIFGPCRIGAKVGNNEIINDLRPFADMCLIPPP